MGLVAGIGFVIAFVAVDTALSHLRLHKAVIDVPIEAAALGVCCIWALWFIVLMPLRDDAENERARTQKREQELIDQQIAYPFARRLALVKSRVRRA